MNLRTFENIATGSHFPVDGKSNKPFFVDWAGVHPWRAHGLFCRLGLSTGTGPCEVLSTGTQQNPRQNLAATTCYLLRLRPASRQDEKAHHGTRWLQWLCVLEEMSLHPHFCPLSPLQLMSALRHWAARFSKLTWPFLGPHGPSYERTWRT